MRSTIVRFFLFVLFVCSSAFSGISQAVSITDIHFKELTLQDGLSDLTILDIAEDKDGYIWIATLSGLNRYSGYDIKQYTPSHDSEHSLPSDIIKALHVDASGQLWVGTYQGLALYRPETDDFQVFTKENSPLTDNFISAISNEVDGDFFISTPNEILKVDTDNNKITQTTILKKYNIEIESLFLEKNKLWLGTKSSSLKIMNLGTKELEAPIKIESKKINQIKKIKDYYWLSTDMGLYRYDHIKAEQVFKESVGNINTFFIEHFDNKIWIGTGKKLVIYDEEDESLTSINSENSEITGLSQKILLSSFTDSQSNIWVGTYQGLFKYNRYESTTKLNSNKKDFTEFTHGTSIWGISEDSKNTIWFVTQSEGIGEYNKKSGKYTYYLEDKDFTIWDLYIDKNDLIWIATSSGLQVYEKEKNSLEKVAVFSEDSFIESIVSSSAGVWFIDNEKSLLTKINHHLIKEKNYIEKTEASSHDFALEAQGGYRTPVFIDEKQRVWISTNSGLEVFSSRKSKVVKKFTNEQKISDVTNVYEWKGSYWVLNRLNTIYQISKESLKIKRIFSPERILTTALMAEGVDNNLWIATTDSIYSVDLISFEIKDFIDTQQLNYNSFNENVSFKSSKGDIYFAGSKGFNIIKPEYINYRNDKVKIARPPKILSLKVFGKNSKNQRNKNLSSNVYKNQLKLKYSESRFSVNFQLINPVYPELTIYRYKLAGFDNEWMDTDGSKTAQFNNVPFGHYTFEVQAKEKGSAWSSSNTIDIVIERPPWLQTPALILYAAIASCIMLFILRQYQVRKQNQLAIKESEERLKLTLWSSGDELWDWDVYRGQVFRSNTWGTLDFPQDNIRTTSAYDANIHPNDLLRVQQSLKAHLEGQSEFFEQAYRAKTFSNRWIWILDRGKVVSRDHNGQPVRMTGTLKNIHHLKEAEEQLNLFKRSIENISEGVFITNTNFKFISVNNAYCRYTGETREQALASYLFFHQYPEPFTEEIKKTLKVKGNWFGEVESVRVNGDKFEIELNIDAVHDEDGKISHFVGVFSDITSRKSTEKELLKLANTDPLTDLPNRSFFQASHANLVRRGESHALLCLDMDNFKKINDSLGHQTGDVLIKQIAKRIQRMTGKTATCYRLGGDEFSVLLEDKSDIHLITHFAQGLLDILARPFIINKQEFVLGASIGIAFYPDDGTTPQEMLKNADTAMYFAKNNGGNSYKFFSGEMNQNAVRQLQIENLIRQGIKDDLFSVYYQPKVDINSGRLVSMEALVRFEHPSKGIVSPGQFIPLAEQTGQIIDIGEQVLRKALIDTKRWVSQGIFSGRVAVNLSAKQFELPDLDDRITKILNEVGLSPLHLECELTEGTLMENPEEGLRMMERLREKGIHLALDDFGTGYSSLAYLKRFPLNTLKIDKAFIDDIAKSNVDRHMAAAIIQIAHNLGLKVVAEGVEEEEQLAILRRYDCEMLQGYLYSRPLSAERFEQLLLENQKLHQLINKHNSH